ncbi:MAG: 4-hydroxyphenylpyruvate dioxygenase [Candidatus Melainabacteria bacterium]|nr:4-hydroxyphenylpyruvate dioxygenase [Candidatus Melainabacteria bacterium]
MVSSSAPNAAPATVENPLRMKGMAFIQFATQEPERVDQIFKAMGLSKTRQHRQRPVAYYNQHDIHFLVSTAEQGFGHDFCQAHGKTTACAIGIRVQDAQYALEEAVRRGAKAYSSSESGVAELNLPAVYGVGGSLIYFVQDDEHGNDAYIAQEFEPLANPEMVPEKGFLLVDHMTNNVFKGTRDTWADFYKEIFGFYEIRYFDIKGEKTGLTSFALRSPCHTFCIPINEGNEDKSQIEEYLRDYNGPGIQHIALLSRDLLTSLDALSAHSEIQTLDIDADYYETVYDRVPQVTEDRERIKRHQVLVDGDERGYLLQIFTQNIFGPIFFEMIQRKNNQGFGEGNFTALFKSIERDQERRGVL